MHTGYRASVVPTHFLLQVGTACAEGYLVITPTQVEAACREGFEGMSKLVTMLLGAEAWLRMVSHSKYSKYSKYSRRRGSAW